MVGIHRATTGCVEVVMDEEFVGGSSLQGLCSNFRGKLCVWAHVMRITVDNSKGLVDKLVPQGSGKVAVEKILLDIENQVKGDKNSLQDSPPSQTPSQAGPRSASGFRTPVRASSAGRPRSDSGSRGKLALSREAKGPPEKGIRFTRAGKNAKTGLHRWKAFMNPSSKSNSSAELKAILGVNSNGKAPSTASRTTADASAGLKSMLGVKPSSILPQAVPDASAGLKAMLGVGATPPPHPPNPNAGFPPPPPPPANAADKLMQLMSMQQPQMQHPQMQHGPVPMSSSFNFSYVEEGKDAPAAPQPPPPPQFVPQFAPPMPMHMHVPPPYGHMPMHMQMPPPPPVMPRPNFPPSGGGAAVVSDEEFPPLGGLATPKLTTPKAETPAKGPPAKAQPAVLVPSIAMAKK